MDPEPFDPLRQGSIVQHWQLPFLGLQAFPTELTAFEIGYFFTFTATVRAATNCDLYVLDKGDFEQVLRDNPKLAASVQEAAKASAGTRP